MLHLGTVEPGTLDILKKLQSIQELDDFYLVGGTALSLRYGHRTSVDLDLFSTSEFDNKVVTSAIRKEFKDFTYRSDSSPVGIFGFIRDVKIDLIKHHYFLQIDQPVVEENIRMYGDRDIIAMKIMAILKRAQKKDFWDMDELLKHYSVQYCIDCYNEKYPNSEIAISIPFALTYFADADDSEEPVSLKGQTWLSVKKEISGAVNEFLK